MAVADSIDAPLPLPRLIDEGGPGVSMSTLRQKIDMLHLAAQGGPAICNISVTNACNATCDFCNYAYDKGLVKGPAFINFDDLCRGLDILYRRGIRYLTFQGGEPLLHPRLPDMIAYSTSQGMSPTLVTNGWLLPRKLEQLCAAGLKSMMISIDGTTVADHESNRGLRGVCDRIHDANSELSRRGIFTMASVTMNKMIGDYHALVPFLHDLGFEAVTFSYPINKAFGSSSLVYSETSPLVDFMRDELVAAFDAVEALKREIEVHNPTASLQDMRRHVRSQPEKFPCFGGYKHFYMDWNLDVYRCESWSERMCSIWDFESVPFIRDGCTACMTGCYRDSSVMLHFAVSIGDAIVALRRGRPDRALRRLMTARNYLSLKALWEGRGSILRMSKLG